MRDTSGRLPMLPAAIALSSPTSAAIAAITAAAPQLRPAPQQHLLLHGHQLLPAGPCAAV
jgi:hypothetical protein